MVIAARIAIVCALRYLMAGIYFLPKPGLQCGESDYSSDTCHAAAMTDVMFPSGP